MTTLHLTDLPPEILQWIFSFTSPVALAQLEATCKAFKELFSSHGPAIYRNCWRFYYSPETRVRLLPASPNETFDYWRLEYQSWHNAKRLLIATHLQFQRWQCPLASDSMSFKLVPSILEGNGVAYPTSGIDINGTMFVCGGWDQRNRASPNIHVRLLNLIDISCSDPCHVQIIQLNDGDVTVTTKNSLPMDPNVTLKSALCPAGEVFSFPSAEPPTRAGMVGVSLVEYNFILFFMGQDFIGYPGKANSDVLLLDTTTLRWYRLPITGPVPSPRAWATVCLSPDSTKAILFGGGCFTSSWKQHALYDDLHVLDLKTLTWFTPVTTGPTPAPRAGHIAAIYHNKLIVGLGGNLGGTVVWGDLYTLDLNTWEWQLIDTKNPKGPPPMGSASSVMIGDCLYIFFGWKGAGQPTSHIVRCLHIPTMSWSRSALSPLVKEQARSATTAQLIRGRVVMAFGISIQQDMLSNVLLAEHLPSSQLVKLSTV